MTSNSSRHRTIVTLHDLCTARHHHPHLPLTPHRPPSPSPHPPSPCPGHDKVRRVRPSLTTFLPPTFPARPSLSRPSRPDLPRDLRPRRPRWSLRRPRWSLRRPCVSEGSSTLAVQWTGPLGLLPHLTLPSRTHTPGI